MKKLLSIVSIVTLAATSIIPTVANVNNTNIRNVTYLANKTKVISSPIKGSLVTTAGDGLKERWEWAYTTINLGQLRQEQVIDVRSTYSDSFTEHKVVSYDYHLIDNDAGVNCQDFRSFFYQGKVTSDWDYWQAASSAYKNFESHVWWSLAHHYSDATIKFMWYYNDNDLLVDIVGSLRVGAIFSGVEGVGSIKLGSAFTIYYTD